MKVDETIDKFKARLVIQGFRQKEGIDYIDTYAPVARITTIRLLLALAAIHNLVIRQMDVKTSFLNGDLDEEVYMKQPERFVMPGNEHKVCKLVKSLFSMKDMRETYVILGIKIKRDNKGIVITQSHYVKKILKKFNHQYCYPVSTPMDPVEKLKPNIGKHVNQLEYSRAIGCLMYAMTSTRPDIAYVVDSSSTSGWVFLLTGSAISWAFKKQTCITGSTLEYEFVALDAAGKEAEWLRNLMHEILIWPKPIAPKSIPCDSVLMMAKAYSQVYNGKSRHLAPYTPQQNGVAERKNRALKEMVNFMLSYSGYSERLWGEAVLTTCYLLNRVPNKRNKTTPNELWFYVIKPNESVSINLIIESRDAIFYENRFSSILRSKDIIPNCVESQRDDHSDDVPSEIPEPRKGKRVRKAKSYGSDFQLYLVEGPRDHVGSQYSYCYNIEEDPRTYDEIMQSWDAAFWKESIDDDIGFRQKEGINYFDTYAPVARITTIRLLLALAAIHNLVIRQMDVKTAFLNGDLDEELEYSIAIGCLMYAMTSTIPDIAYVIGKLSRYPSVLEAYSDASWINHVGDSSSTSGWVFLLRGALDAAGKEVKWLRNLMHEILIWPKSIAPISIRCDSVFMMAKAYSQVYNGKSRHLGVRHSMIRKLIMKGCSLLRL
nr:zinc finger, CCHC-type [Tanacetum cinerariifolium]